jgi:hypothetical protein
MSEANNIVNFKPATGVRLTYQRLWEIAQLVEMTHPRIQGRQSDARPSGTEEANRPRVLSETGGNNLFRGVVGVIGDSNPIGSIEDGPIFVPAPGVTFSHHDLRDIAGRLKQKADAAKA